jgi:hypothetical protein
MVRECKYGSRVAGKCPKKPVITKAAASKKKASKTSLWQMAIDNATNYSQAMVYFRESKETVIRKMKEDGIFVAFDPYLSRLMKPFIRILINILQTHPEELADFFDHDLTLTWMHPQIIKEAIDQILYIAATIARGPYKFNHVLVQTKDVVKAFKRISFVTRVMEIANRT